MPPPPLTALHAVVMVTRVVLPWHEYLDLVDYNQASTQGVTRFCFHFGEKRVRLLFKYEEILASSFYSFLKPAVRLYR